MTRFMMDLDQAVDLVIFAFNNGNNGDIFVQKAPAATLNLLAIAIRNLAGKPSHPIHYIGTRHGEKLYETLLTKRRWQSQSIWVNTIAFQQIIETSSMKDLLMMARDLTLIVKSITPTTPTN